MSDAISTLTNLPTAASSIYAASAQTSANSTDASDAFSQVLLSMLLSNSNSSLGASSGGLGSDLFTPIMMMPAKSMDMKVGLLTENPGKLILSPFLCSNNVLSRERLAAVVSMPDGGKI